MIKIKCKLYIILLLGFYTLHVQSQHINGQLKGKGHLEGIHIINQTQKKYTTSNKQGQFIITANAQDTLLISSIRYKVKTIQINSKMVKNKHLIIKLEDQINVLDEVVVGKVLTGRLESDVANSNAKRDINFYDVGIPGFKGKRKTQNE